MQTVKTLFILWQLPSPFSTIFFIKFSAATVIIIVTLKTTAIINGHLFKNCFPWILILTFYTFAESFYGSIIHNEWCKMFVLCWNKWKYCSHYYNDNSNHDIWVLEIFFLFLLIRVSLRKNKGKKQSCFLYILFSMLII